MKTRKPLSLIMVISMLVALLTAPAMVTNAAETTVPGGARASQYVLKDTATFNSSNFNTNVWFQNSTRQWGFVDSGDGKALRLNDEIGNGWGGFMTKTALESYKVEGKVRTVLYSKEGAAAICARMNTDQSNRGLACAPNFANNSAVGGSRGKGTVYFTMSYVGTVNPTEGKMAVIIADKTTAATETFTFDLPQGVNFTNETAFEMVDNGRAIVLYCNDKFICSVDTASKVVNLYNGTQQAYTGEVNASGAFGVGGHAQAIYLDDVSLSYIKREIPELVQGEDFSSYSTGAFSTQGNWTVSDSGFEIVKNANGYNGNVLVLNAIKNQSQTAAFVLDSDKYLSAPFNVTTKFWDNGTPNGAIYCIDYTNGKQDFLASFIGGTNNGKFQLRADVTGTRLQTTNAGVSLSEGWHDFKVVADEKGVISYYIDEAPLTNNGAAIQLQLPEGVKVKGFTVRNAGWNSPDFTAYIPYVNFYQYDAVPGTYAVNFDLDGKGTAGETALVVVEGTVPTAPVVTANEGYIFKGWDKGIVAATENVTYTAQYEAIDYTVKFVADGEVISEEVYEHGATVVVPEAPEKVGYTFVGWDAEVVNATADATYTAVYEINKYTVKFVADETVVSEEVYEHGAEVVVPEAPAKEGYTFIGWSPEIADVVTEDATYVAQYEAIPYVAVIGEAKFETLGAAVAAAVAGDTITLVDDVTVDEIVKLEKAVTLDLGGFDLTSTAAKAIEVYADATIKNGTVTGVQRAVDTRKAVTLNLEDVELYTTSTKVNTQPLTIGGAENGTVVNVKDSTIDAGNIGYGIITFVESDINVENTEINGYATLYFKEGSAGTTADVDAASVLNAGGVAGERFGAIVTEETDITVTVAGTINMEEVAGAENMAIVFKGDAANNAIALNGAVTGAIIDTYTEGATVTTTNAEVAEAIKGAGFTVKEENGVYTVVETPVITTPYKDILTLRAQGISVDEGKKQITVTIDRYKFNLASSTYGIAIVPNDGETVAITYNHDNGTAGTQIFKKFSTDKYSAYVAGANNENGGGVYGSQPLYIIDRANGTRVYLDVAITKADGSVETYEIIVKHTDLAVEGDVDITEVLPLRADADSVVVDNDAKTIYLESSTAYTSAGLAVAVDNGLDFATRPRRLVTAKSGQNLAHGEIKNDTALQNRFDRYVVAKLSAGLEQTFQIKVQGGEDGLTYTWYTVTVKFNRVHEGDIEFTELLTKNADTCEFDNENNIINVTYSGDSVAVAPVVVSGTRVYLDGGIATSIDGVKAVAVKSANGAEQTAKITLKIGNDTTDYTVNFNYVG